MSATSRPDTPFGPGSAEPRDAPEPGHGEEPVLDELGGSHPSKIGRYAIRGVLGAGGSGIVFRAYDPTFDAEVALKVPLPWALVSPEARNRFMTEARSAARLDHPNIARILECGRAGIVSYIAMTLVDGTSLAEWISNQSEPVDARLAARLVAELADAAEHAHASGILHRDIKPGNVLISRRDGAADSPSQGWIPRLIDFGLARMNEGSDGYTKTGVGLGTLAFTSPEQASGRLEVVGVPSDIYGLGATLYTLLAGAAPFHGQSPAETARCVIHDEPRPLRALRPKLPADLETICMKCLSKEPGARYASAKALRDDLHRFLGGRPVLARPVPRWRRVLKWTRRRPAHAALIACFLAALVAVPVGMRWINSRLMEASKRADKQAEEAENQRRLAANSAYVRNINLAATALQNDQPEKAQDLLLDLDPDDRRLRPHEFVWRHLWGEATKDVRILSPPSRLVNPFALRADGRQLAIGMDNHEVRVIDLEHDHVVTTFFIGEWQISALALSPDGQLLALAVSRQESDAAPEIMLWNTARHSVRSRMAYPVESIHQLQFDSTGRFLWARMGKRSDRPFRLVLHAIGPNQQSLKTVGSWDIGSNLPVSSSGRSCSVGSGSLGLRIFDLDLGSDVPRERIRFPDHSSAHEITALSPDGKVLAALEAATRRLVALDAEQGQELGKFEQGPETIEDVRISADRRYVATANVAGDVRIHDLKEQRTSSIPRDPQDPASGSPLSFCLVPNSTTLAWTYAGRSSGPRGLRLYDLATGERLRTRPGRLRKIRGVDILASPDGESVISSYGGRAERWKLHPRIDHPDVAGHKDEAWCVRFSPDGRLLATSSDDTDESQTIKLWDTATGALVRGWHGHPATVSTVAFSPDGKLLVSGSLSASDNLKVWDVATGAAVGELNGHVGSVRTVAFGPLSSVVFSGSDDRTVRIWDLDALRCEHVLQGHTAPVRSLAVGREGRFVDSASHDGTVRRWSVDGSSSNVLFRSAENLNAMVHDDSDNLIVASDERQGISVCDGSTGAVIRSFLTGDDTPLCIAGSPDGHTLVVGGTEGVVSFWDPATGQRFLVSPRLKAQVNSLSFSPDGTILAAALHDGSIKFWRAPIPRAAP